MPRVFVLLLSLSIAACSSDAPTEPESETPTDVVPRGDRILALDVKEGAGYDYMTALGDALDAGVQDVKHSFDWDVTAASFEGENDFVTIADLVFSQVDAEVTLVLRPVDTSRHTYPDGVAGDLDDPAAVAAFADFVDAIWDRTASLRAQGKIGAILVGNEIDGYLGTDAERWEQFGRFLAAARMHVLSRDWGSTPMVAAVLMAGGARDATIRQLYETHVLPSCDDVVLNYYALGAGFRMLDPADVGDELRALVDLFPGRTIRLQECGMSSGSACGSTPQRQAEFVSAVFTAWDDLADRISHVDFAWQTDVDDATADGWVGDYGMSGHPDAAAFRDYLRTLGLRENDGTPKPAWDRFVDEASARGW